VTKQVQEPTAAQSLQELYGLLGKISLSLDETIVPVTIVDSVTGERERKAFGTLFTTRAAVEFSEVQLFNPANSGVLVFAEQVYISMGLASFAEVRIFDTPLTTAGTEQGWRDGRRAGNPAAGLRQSTNVAIQGARRLNLGFVVADERFPVPLGITLLPGQGVHVACNIVNIQVVASYYWWERNLLPSE